MSALPMLALVDLLAAHSIPAAFTREHDVILLVQPWISLTATPDTAWTPSHSERLGQMVQRRFVRSAQPVRAGNLHAALEASCTAGLGYRTTAQLPGLCVRDSLLLTCAPNAHLALAHYLERGALFDAEAIGRVERRHVSVPLAKP